MASIDSTLVQLWSANRVAANSKSDLHCANYYIAVRYSLLLSESVQEVGEPPWPTVWELPDISHVVHRLAHKVLGSCLQGYRRVCDQCVKRVSNNKPGKHCYCDIHSISSFGGTDGLYIAFHFQNKFIYILHMWNLRN